VSIRYSTRRFRNARSHFGDVADNRETGESRMKSFLGKSVQPRAETGFHRGLAVVSLATVTAAVVMLLADLTFLGFVAKEFYDEALGELRSPQVYWPAALGFYTFYVGSVVWFAVLHASSVVNAATRGASMGLFAYAVYELTNLAVIAGWPGRLVPIDLVWGTLLTASVAATSYAAASLLLPNGAVNWMTPFPIRLADDEGIASVWIRRALSIPVVLFLTLLFLSAVPLWLSVTVLFDLTLGPQRKWAKSRSGLFFLLYLCCETWGIVSAAAIWLGTLGGRIVGHNRYVAYNAAFQRRWSEALLRGAFRIFSMRLEIEGQEVAEMGPFLLLVRHSSTADTVLAASIVANRYGLLLRYVLKRDLLWDPCLDIVGRRLPNAFVDRSGTNTQRAIARVAQLGQAMDRNSAVLIYPEGTRFSEEKRTRYIEGLRNKGRDHLAEVAAGMRYVLPPQTAGVLALIDAAPDVDVVLLAHVGFEGARDFAAFIEGDLVGRVVRAKLWRIPGSSIPLSDRELWLFQRWAEVDSWVASETQH
jgi:uncharacterized membrane protein/1-acyl-sn-glycerol-3-phosphate acyltransferase